MSNRAVTLNRGALLKGFAAVGAASAAGCSSGASSLLTPTGGLLTSSSDRRLEAARSIVPNATATSIQRFTDSGVTYTITQTNTAVSLSYSVNGSAPKVICSIVVDSTGSSYTTSPQGFAPVTIAQTAPNAAQSVFNSTITPTSDSTANYTLGATGVSGTNNYSSGSATTSGTYSTNSYTANVPYPRTGGGGNCQPGHSCSLVGTPKIGRAGGVGLGAGLVGVIGGIAAIAEIGFLISPAGFAIACVLIAAATFGLFYAIAF